MNEPTKNNSPLIFLLSSLLLFAVLVIIFLTLQNSKLSTNKIIACAPCPVVDKPSDEGTDSTGPNEHTPISQEQLDRGWYWGAQDQKLSGTPSDWVYKTAGRSSCWHDKNVLCIPSSTSNTYTCPEAGYIDCMPTIGLSDRTYKCTSEAISWYQENCPNFKGVAY